MKRNYIYIIENTDSQLGVSGVLLRILFYLKHVDVPDRLAQYDALRINLLNIMIQKTLLRGRGTSIIMNLNESNKEVKVQNNNNKKHKKNKILCELELRTFWL